MPLTLPLPDPNAQCRQLAELLRPRMRSDTALIGIFSGGAWVAERVAELLDVSESIGLIDVSFYRDDFERIGLHPNVRPTSIPFTVQDRHVVLFDDVLHTGRTTRAALNVLFDFGRAAKVELAVLADRGGRELPIAPQYCVWPITPEPSELLILDKSDDGLLSWRVGRAEASRDA